MITIDEARKRGTVTVKEGAEILGISESKYYKGAKLGQLPALRIGRKVLVPVRPLLRLIEGVEPLAAGEVA